MDDRREDRNPGTSGPGSPGPAPRPVPPKVPDPIPWISREPPSRAPAKRPAIPRFGWSGCHWQTDCPRRIPRGKARTLRIQSGSFPISDEAIDETLMRTSPGNYALGYMDGDAFVVFYVGRSDCDLPQRLHDRVGMPSRYERYASPAKAPWGSYPREPLFVDTPASARVENAENSYTHFAYSYACSADEAHAKEWRNYDAFGGTCGLDNESEPISVIRSRTDLSPNAAAAPLA